MTREQAKAEGYTETATPYAGTLQAGDRFTVSKGRLGQVRKVTQVVAWTHPGETRPEEGYTPMYKPGAYQVDYESINPKTDRPWQASKHTTVERVLAALVVRS